MAESNTPKFEDTEPVFDETTAIDEPKFDDTVEIPEEISKMDSALEGARQGATMGFSDEGVGLAGAGLDATQALLNKLGLASPSPSQVSEKLAAEGVTGDVGPQALLEVYRRFRNEDRATMEAAQKANPGSFLTGAVAGGLATMPAIPGKIAAPLGAVAKNAPLAQKVGTGLVNALPTGAIGGLGMSEADLTQGDVTGALKDTALGTAIAGGMGALAPVVGAGLSGTKNGITLVIPQEVKDAYAKGKQGIDTASQEFYDATTGKLRGLVDDVSDVLTSKTGKQQAAAAQELSNLDNQMMRVQDDVKSAVARGQERASVQSAKDIAEQQKNEIAVAEKVQGRIAQLRKRLGKNYDRIDKAAEKLGIAPDSGNVVRNFIDDITTNSEIGDQKVQAMAKQLINYASAKTPQANQQLKDHLSKLFNHENRAVSSAAKKAYADLRNSYLQAFNEAGYESLANKLVDNNKRWATALQLEDEFFSNVRKIGQLADRDSLNTIGKFAAKDSKQAADAAQAAQLLQTLDPKQAPSLIKGMTKVADEGVALKGASQAVPELPNPEVARLQGLIDQAKGKVKDASSIEGLPLPVDNPEALKNQLTNLLPKQGAQTGQNVAENQLTDLMGVLRQEKGDDFVKNITSRIDDTNRDLAVREAATAPKKLNMKKAGMGGAIGAGAGFASGGPVGAAVGGAIGGTVGSVADMAVGGAVGLANKAGQSVASSQALLQNGVRVLSDSTPEALKAVASKLSAKGGQGLEYAKVLAQAADKNSQSRNAIIFGLMQQPGFREMFREIEKGENE